MIVMNNRLKCFYLLLSCLFFLSLGQAQHIDQAPINLEHVSNLFKWSDLIVIASRDEYANTIQVEEFILNKRADIDCKSCIEINTLIKQQYVPPVVMRGYRYLFLLSVLDAEEASVEEEDKIICKITGGGNGVVALFDLDELQDHPRILRSKRIMPKYDLVKDFKNTLHKNFGTSNGLKIKEAVERVVALYEEEDPKAQAERLIESLRDGNPAMIRLSRELLQSIDLDAID